MGHHSKANMLAVRAALDELTLAKDGVDGSKIYLYGEGWNFGEVANNARFVQATQANMAGTGIGTFNDRLRDAVRGGGPFDGDPGSRASPAASSTDPNGNPINGTPAEQRARLLLLPGPDQGRPGREPRRTTAFVDRTGALVTGAQVDYNGSPAGYNGDPQEAITYVEAHDNETLFDALRGQAADRRPRRRSGRGRRSSRSRPSRSARACRSSTPGSDLLRSKSMDKNSFNSGDWFNRLFWDCSDNGFGAGLPPAADNGSRYPYLEPLLANPAIKPTPAEIEWTAERFRELLEIRRSSRLFRIGDADEIERRLTFANGGPAQVPGLIVMKLSDEVAPDLDPGAESIVVLFNATPVTKTWSEPALRGRHYKLHEAAADVRRRAHDRVPVRARPGSLPCLTADDGRVRRRLSEDRNLPAATATRGRRRPLGSGVRHVGLAGALEREPALPPLVLAAGVVADVRVPERDEPRGRLDRALAPGIRAVDDDLGLRVGQASGGRRLDVVRREVDRAGQVRVRVRHRRECVDEHERLAALELVLQLLAGDRGNRHPDQSDTLAHVLVALPQPYDFDLSTARFHVYGRDRRAPLARRRPAPRDCRTRGEDRSGAGRRRRDAARRDDRGRGPDAARARRSSWTAFATGRRASRPWLASSRRSTASGRRSQPDPFEALVTSITAQQVSLQSAAAIRSRFVERYGLPGVHAHAFPTRERVAGRVRRSSSALGFSARKAEYVVGLARSDLDLDALAQLPDDEVTRTARRAARARRVDRRLVPRAPPRRPHAWPAGDLGLRKAVAAFYGDVPDVRAFGARFHPFENLSAHYLLTGLRLLPPT